MPGVLVRAATAGTGRFTACPDCGSERIDTDMVGLSDDGPVILGLMVSCLGCGRSWRCAFCPAVLPLSGTAAFNHVSAEHEVRAA